MQTSRPALAPNVLRVPIVGAPLAGGPTTPALAAAVSEAGGLGFLAAGYKTAAAVEPTISTVLRELTSRARSAQSLLPARERRRRGAVGAYASRLRGEGERYGVEPGEPRWTDDDWTAKLELVRARAARRRLVHVRLPRARRRRMAARLREPRLVHGHLTGRGRAGGCGRGRRARRAGRARPAGIRARSTNTTTNRLAARAAAVVRTRNRNAARRSRRDREPGDVARAWPPARPPRRSARRCCWPPRRAPRAAAPASAARRRPTKLTRAFTGRRARGIVNRFMLEHDADAPRAYPEIHYLTAPIRAAARRARRRRGDQPLGRTGVPAGAGKVSGGARGGTRLRARAGQPRRESLSHRPPSFSRTGALSQAPVARTSLRCGGERLFWGQRWAGACCEERAVEVGPEVFDVLAADAEP